MLPYLQFFFMCLDKKQILADAVPNYRYAVINRFTYIYIGYLKLNKIKMRKKLVVIEFEILRNQSLACFINFISNGCEFKILST